MWLRNCWYVAARPNELDEPFLARRILNEPVLMLRTEDGQVAALEDRCPHRRLPLSAGSRCGDFIKCGYHGLVFDAQGRCVEIPGQSVVPAAVRAKVYPVLQRHGLIWIWMGKPELADPDLVPDVSWMDNPFWKSVGGYLRIQADYRLLTDNLLDLSHETYVHSETIGNSESETIAAYPITISKTPSTLHARRDMRGIAPPPAFTYLLKEARKIDRLQIASFLAPCLNMTQSGGKSSDDAGDYLLLARVMHLLTPETDHSTHYFWALCRTINIDDEEMSRLLGEATSHTFEEDKIILELQQHVLLEEPDAKLPRFAIALDSAAIQARRMLDAAVAREQADPSFVLRPGLLVDDPKAVVERCA